MRLRGPAIALVTTLIAGCASLPAPPPLGPAATPEAFAFSGRLAVREADQNLAGSVHWRHDAESDEILLSTPLGQGVAQIVNDANGATLTTNDGKIYRAADAEQLTAKITGWHIPVSGLTFWLRGLPQTGNAAHEERDDRGRLKHLAQDDWKIEYSAYFDAPDDRLPKRIVLTRPQFEFRLVIDNWERAAGAAPPALAPRTAQ
jgi:outer membrane lipoprotein LolB